MDCDSSISTRTVLLELFRSDNAIKNYFYCTIRRTLRRMGKVAGSKNSTYIMNNFKPHLLSYIFAADHEHSLEALASKELILREKCQRVKEEIIRLAKVDPNQEEIQEE